jgi:hypothetical protein
MLATLGVLLRLCCHPALIPQYVVRAADGSTSLAPTLPTADAGDDEAVASDHDDEEDEEIDDESCERQRKSGPPAPIPLSGYGIRHCMLRRVDGSLMHLFSHSLIAHGLGARRGRWTSCWRAPASWTFFTRCCRLSYAPATACSCSAKAPSCLTWPAASCSTWCGPRPPAPPHTNIHTHTVAHTPPPLQSNPAPNLPSARP